jgi:hypothetical protein
MWPRRPGYSSNAPTSGELQEPSASRARPAGAVSFSSGTRCARVGTPPRRDHEARCNDAPGSGSSCSLERPELGQRIPLAGVAHQNGTIRFGRDPRTSALDPACRAHGVDNLYVVDASFFPTSGAVNPALAHHHGQRPARGGPHPGASGVTHRRGAKSPLRALPLGPGARARARARNGTPDRPAVRRQVAPGNAGRFVERALASAAASLHYWIPAVPRPLTFVGLTELPPVHSPE